MAQAADSETPLKETAQETAKDASKESTEKDEQTYHYIEKEAELTPEHLELFKQLQEYRSDILSKKIEWRIHEIEDRWKIDTIDTEAILEDLKKEQLESNSDSKSVNDDTTSNNSDENKTNEILNTNETETKDCNTNESKSDEPIVSEPTSPRSNDKATEELYTYFKEYCTDETLIRHLVGADYHIEKSKQALLRTVEWRVLSKIDEIVPQQFEKVLNCKAVYCLNKFDKKGHPICYFKILDRQLEDPWDFVKAAVFTVVMFCFSFGFFCLYTIYIYSYCISFVWESLFVYTKKAIVCTRHA